MVSYDVQSLKIYLLKRLVIFVLEGISKKYFIKLLEMSVINIYFIFDQKFYIQRKGEEMGLPLGSTFAMVKKLSFQI